MLIQTHLTFFCLTLKEMFNRMSKLLDSMQNNWVVTKNWEKKSVQILWWTISYICLNEDIAFWTFASQPLNHTLINALSFHLLMLLKVNMHFNRKSHNAIFNKHCVVSGRNICTKSCLKILQSNNAAVQPVKVGWTLTSVKCKGNFSTEAERVIIINVTK